MDNNFRLQTNERGCCEAAFGQRSVRMRFQGYAYEDLGWTAPRRTRTAQAYRELSIFCCVAPDNSLSSGDLGVLSEKRQNVLGLAGGEIIAPESFFRLTSTGARASTDRRDCYSPMVREFRALPYFPPSRLRISRRASLGDSV